MHFACGKAASCGEGKSHSNQPLGRLGRIDIQGRTGCTRAQDRSFEIKTAQAAQGLVGMALALPTGGSFAAGEVQLVQVTFKALATTAGTTVGFGDLPVIRVVSSPTADELGTAYLESTVMVQEPPRLRISNTGGDGDPWVALECCGLRLGKAGFELWGVSGAQ